MGVRCVSPIQVQVEDYNGLNLTHVEVEALATQGCDALADADKWSVVGSEHKQEARPVCCAIRNCRHTATGERSLVSLNLKLHLIEPQ